MEKKVLIIGAGLGSLATALRLSSRGYQVEIVEKYSQPGGRLNELKKDGFTFDIGPSFFSMSYEFKELFEDCGIENPLTFEEMDPIYSVYFSHRKQPYHVYKKLADLGKEFRDIEPDFEKRAEKYLKIASELFHDTEYRIVKKNFNSILDYMLTLSTVPMKHAPYLFRNMWDELNRHFESYEVKVIFSLVAFFLGGTPFDTPSVYSLLNYTELQHDGYWNVKGGMYEIVRQFVKKLEERGVQFHYNTEIVDVHSNGQSVYSFIDQNGKKWSADIFIANADAASFRGDILKRPAFNEKKLDKMTWTLGPYTIYLGVKGKVDGLNHHNYFLGDNFEEYAHDIFNTSVAPKKPYYYVSVISKSNPEMAPPDCENIFILCPVPDLRFKPDWSDSEQLADDILSDMSERVGFDFKNNTISRTILTPIEWRDMFNLYKGSGLGLGHNMLQVGGFRPSNKDEVFKNLYYVGASTVPGTGLPIVVISSKLVTQRIEADA